MLSWGKVEGSALKWHIVMSKVTSKQSLQVSIFSHSLKLTHILCINCIIADIVCPGLSAPENGNVTSNGFSGWGGEVTYSCNEGYSLEGETERTCQRTATWSLSAPTCESKCKYVKVVSVL